MKLMSASMETDDVIAVVLHLSCAATTNRTLCLFSGFRVLLSFAMNNFRVLTFCELSAVGIV